MKVQVNLLPRASEKVTSGLPGLKWEVGVRIVMWMENSKHNAFIYKGAINYVGRNEDIFLALLLP